MVYADIKKRATIDTWRINLMSDPNKLKRWSQYLDVEQIKIEELYYIYNNEAQYQHPKSWMKFGHNNYNFSKMLIYSNEDKGFSQIKRLNTKLHKDVS